LRERPYSKSSCPRRPRWGYRVRQLQRRQLQRQPPTHDGSWTQITTRNSPDGGGRRGRRPDGSRTGSRRSALPGRLRWPGAGAGQPPPSPRTRALRRGRRFQALRHPGRLWLGGGLWALRRLRSVLRFGIIHRFGSFAGCWTIGRLRIIGGGRGIVRGYGAHALDQPAASRRVGFGGWSSQVPERDARSRWDKRSVEGDAAHRRHRRLDDAQRPGCAPARHGLHPAARHRDDPAQHSPARLKASAPPRAVGPPALTRSSSPAPCPSHTAPRQALVSPPPQGVAAGGSRRGRACLAGIRAGAGTACGTSAQSSRARRAGRCSPGRARRAATRRGRHR
jgi:hypothetical protein